MTNSTGRPWDRYRLSAQTAERQTEGHRLKAASPFDPPVTPRKKTRIGTWWAKQSFSTAEAAIVGVATAGIAAASVLLFGGVGATPTASFALVALIPLAFVAWIIARSDRIAPTPKRFPVFAVIWGAGVATAVAGVVNSALMNDLLMYLGEVNAAEVSAAVLVAPVTEELLKGVGAVVILIAARQYVVSVSSGVTIGGLTGAGFAFTENILYFAQAHAEGSASLGVTIFARAVMSPFVHPLATSFIGMGVATAILVPRGWWARTWRIGLGWIAAMAVHAAWNGLASLGVAWLAWYLLLELPIFIIWLVWILRRPAKQLPLLRQGLLPYVATGWISNDELEMVSNPRGRRYALKWGRKVGKIARRSVREYLKDAGRLGLEQVQIERRDLVRDRVIIAQESLSRMLSNREIYLEQGELAAAEGRIGQ